MKPYKANIVHVGKASEIVCKCSACEWQGRASKLKEIVECDLTPGDESPAGRCPKCESLAYVLPTEEAVRDLPTNAQSKPDTGGHTDGESSIKVKHWSCYNCAQSPDEFVVTHQIDVSDQRVSNGQVYLTVGAIEGNVDDLLSLTAEVNTNPYTGIEHVPCIHVHFDNDALAMTLFKIGNKIVLRLETDVSITQEAPIAESSEQGFWIIE